MKALFVVAFALVSFNLFASDACNISFKKTEVCAELTWIYGPFIGQQNSAKLQYSENPNVAAVKVIPWMVMVGGHEHGSSPVKVTKTGDREILVENIFIMGGMKGEWFLRIQLLDAKNAVIEEVREKINL